MKTPIEVRLVGPTLLCQAVEALLATVAPIYPEGSGSVGTGENTEDIGNTRRRQAQSTPQPVVVLLIGEGWQQRVLAESRLLRRNGSASLLATNAGAAPRYALIADGNKVDFYGARKMAVNAFIGSDEPVTVLVQGIQAAAQNRLYCSPQLLPALIEAVGNIGGPAGTAESSSTRNGESESSGQSDTALAAGLSVSGGESPRNATESSNASQAALLSVREHEVALHAARGLSNEQIAVFLGISVPTVKFHLMHAFRKLRIQRRTQLYSFMPYLTSATEALLPPIDN